jgi:acetyl esterase/lipase
MPPEDDDMRPAMVLAALLLAPAVPGEGPYKSSPVDTAHGDREFLLLWPDGAPGALGAEPADRPKITLYRAAPEHATRTAAIVCPGGSYANLSSDHEGRQAALWLNAAGVSAFVLQYRVGPRYRHPAPLQDVQRALRLVRSRAKDLGVDPARVGIVGFSAGGHLAARPARPSTTARPTRRIRSSGWAHGPTSSRSRTR